MTRPTHRRSSCPCGRTTFPDPSRPARIPLCRVSPKPILYPGASAGRITIGVVTATLAAIAVNALIAALALAAGASEDFEPPQLSAYAFLTIVIVRTIHRDIPHSPRPAAEPTGGAASGRSRLVRRASGFSRNAARMLTAATTAQIRKMRPVASP
jgi:hypothetical protein